MARCHYCGLAASRFTALGRDLCHLWTCWRRAESEELAERA